VLDAADQDIFDRQTRRYGGHAFTTVTGKELIISERMPLADAVDMYNTVSKQLGQVEFGVLDELCSAEENQKIIEELRGCKEIAHAEAMAAFYRAAQCWPKDAKEALGL
jgi:hypothetical protein